MSTSFPYVDNHHIAHHKIAFNDSPEVTNDPPPIYKSSYDFRAEEPIAVINPSPLSQSTQNLVDALGSILDVSCEKEQLIESLETALRQQPAAKHKQIFDIAQSIFDACRNVYEPKEDSLTSNREGKHQPVEEKDLDASHQRISAKDQLELQESAQALKLSQANSSKKVLRSEATSSNTNTLPIQQGRNTKRPSTPFATSQMTCDTASHESSRLTSPGAEDTEMPAEIKAALEKIMPKFLENMDTPPLSKDAPQKETPEGPKKRHCQLRSLIDQSIEDFTFHAHEQIIDFTWYRNSVPAVNALIRSLDGEESEAESLCPKLEWSSGSKWLSLALDGEKDKKMGTIICALAAMELRKWHVTQRQQHEDLPPQSASKLVTDRLVGPRPAGSYQQKNWAQRRSNISTLLTRGNKWAELVKQLGLGILFMGASKLGKTPEGDLTPLIKELEKDKAKMTVLHILSKQLKYFVKYGKTKQQEFEDELRNASLGVSFIPSNDFVELDNLRQAISEAVTSDRLYIHESQPPYGFKVAALRRLKGNTWLNDELLVACLHLSDKLPFVRIGWSIHIHQDIRPNTPMEQQFERASQTIQAWKKKAKSQLVYFFPLYQHGNHFTLLEINEKEGYVYHYDSMSGDSTDVKNACEQQFSHLPFREKEAMQQKDGDSCGFMVIKHAQNRMRGLPANHHGGAIDSTSLRCEVINLFKAAWNDGALVEALVGSKRKRGAEIEDVDLGGTRRKRVVKASKY